MPLVPGTPPFTANGVADSRLWRLMRVESLTVALYQADPYHISLIPAYHPATDRHVSYGVLVEMKDGRRERETCGRG